MLLRIWQKEDTMTGQGTKKADGVELVVEEPQAVEIEREDEPQAEEKQPAEPKKATRRRKPKHRAKDRVRVRVNADHGMLAGKAVFRGEVHVIFYYQYERARETGGDAYELIDDN